MGQKVHPYALRIGINKGWKSRWYVNPKEYAKTLHEDIKIRNVILALPESRAADVSDVEIIRHPQKVTVIIHTSHPGVFIGAKGANIEKIGNEIYKKVNVRTSLKVKEIKRAEADSQCVALSVAKQLKGRSSFRRVLKMAVSSAMKGGAQGIKIKISGRLAGAEMARSVEMKEGRVPLQTLRADIDYGFAEVNTTYGIIGVKVWIFKGEVLKKEKRDELKEDSLRFKDRSEGFKPKNSTEKRVRVPKEVKAISTEEVTTEEKAVKKVTRAKKVTETVEDESAPKKTTRKKAVKEADDAKSE